MTENIPVGRDEPVKRGRGRPRKDSSFKPLNREVIAEAALDIAGAEGYAALTMHRLAEVFGVTPRALYNYVSDRADVVSLAMDRFIELSPFIELDPDDWQASLRKIYDVTRGAYRAYPRASLVTVDEQIHIEISPRRALLMERLLEFFTALGLSLAQSVALVRSLEREVFGFVLQVDYYFDRNKEAGQRYLSRLVPDSWLTKYSGVQAPLARQALELPPKDNNELFEELVELRLMAVRSMLEGCGSREQPLSTA